LIDPMLGKLINTLYPCKLAFVVLVVKMDPSTNAEGLNYMSLQINTAHFTASGAPVRVATDRAEHQAGLAMQSQRSNDHGGDAFATGVYYEGIAVGACGLRELPHNEIFAMQVAAMIHVMTKRADADVAERAAKPVQSALDL